MTNEQKRMLLKESRRILSDVSLDDLIFSLKAEEAEDVCSGGLEEQLEYIQDRGAWDRLAKVIDGVKKI